ncbi:tyrosine-protein phosphatase [Adlercreutzia sp. R25]|uniref:tyrosine-protein phosphatase n=1 Tax=Adlercreutzia shanghongiae TaxID=3111773 RepID=UPI002DC0616C|nr:tyrosine-protein phosphatase [Adlercreutzia sp. R25]MEC4273181.1 tyrosine-protein phosphatase [Adlercreutzia sp. R25]
MGTEGKQEQTMEASRKLDLPEEVPGFPEFGHIPFEGLHNTRDLGGLPAADGRRIKPALLLRSGALHKATEQDLARLLADYHLEGVVDFRTELERDKEPDPRELMEGVVFYDFPALAGESMGITHGAGLAKDMKTLEAVKAQPHEMVKKMYPEILLGDAGLVAYRSLLNVLLESDGGAVLWHCTEGKDRAGLGAVVVERALGVPEPDVRADYLATNLFARTRAEGILDALAAKLPALRGLDADIDSFFYAYADYYDAAMDAVADAFGTFDAYLAEALDFGPEKQAALRAKYLA